METGTAAGPAEGGRVSCRGFPERKEGERLNEAKALGFRGKSPQGRVLISDVMGGWSDDWRDAGLKQIAVHLKTY